MGTIVLISGGARSGKSAHALTLAHEARVSRRFFLATAQALDDEMAARIERHRVSRPAEFQTVEEPLNLATVVRSLDAADAALVIDGLTVWVSNLISAGFSDAAIEADGAELVSALQKSALTTFVVSDEVGMGIVPENAVARRFRDLLGLINQRTAAAAEQVLLMVAGYPLRVK